MINLTNKVKNLGIVDDIVAPGDGSCSGGCCNS